MTEQEIAAIAERITQTVKENLEADPPEVIQLILTELPQLTTDEIIKAFTSLGDQLAIQYDDVNDLIIILQDTATFSTTEIQKNIHWQDIAQVLFAVLSVVKGLVPGPWAKIILLVLDAYTVLKGGNSEK